MGIGQWFNSNPIVAVVVAVAALCTAGYFVFQTSFGSDTGSLETRYYYDLESGDIFTHNNVPAPITTESGSKAVWAHMFSCGSCDDPSQRFVGYLHSFTTEAKQEMDKPKDQRDVSIVIEGGRYAMVPDEPGQQPQWVPVESPAGMRIAEQHNMQCAPEMPKPCSP